MKKIDLHIHTIPSISDSHFEFNLDSLKKYIEKLDIDCIAITNHNLFDKQQFKNICENLTIKVFPGIEIDLENGHILLISENADIDDFDLKCNRVKNLLSNKGESITYEQLVDIFPVLNKYLLIPHYDKKPNIKDETIKKLGKNVFAGEVTSLRKFKTCIKETDKLTPVIFSDCRFIENMESFSTKQTFVDAEDTTLNAIKGCLYDKSKVSLSKEEGNNFFQSTDDGIMLSTGLNIIIGERSSGKTHTLNKICKNFENVKYIEQFSLLQNDEENFKKLATTRHSLITENYLKEFKEVVLDVNSIDVKSNELIIENYIESLKKYASENNKLDTFSNCKLYNETQFQLDKLDNIKTLIAATKTLIDNIEYKELISKHVDNNLLRNLIKDLIEKHDELHESNNKKKWINELVDRVKQDLRFKSTTTSIEEIDLYKFQLEKLKVEKFIVLVKNIQFEKEIDSKEIRGFKVVA